MTKNQNVLKWVEEMKALTQPDKVVWIDGSEEQLKALRDEAIATGEMIELNQEKLPGCLYHRTAEKRRCPCRRQNIHLLKREGECRSYKQLDGS